MEENQKRRQAHRQKRGLLRVEEILRVAESLFVEQGYDNVTTGMIAARAGLSPGSLYQFFPNKEAITYAYAVDVADSLHTFYEGMLRPDLLDLPFPGFVDTFVDGLVAVNRQHPGYLALALGSTISPPLALVLADLQQGLQADIDAIFALRWQGSTPEQRRLPLLISYRSFLALLALLLGGDTPQQDAVLREMKALFYRYWQPIIGL